MSSQQKTAANRENAQHSTGPTSDAVTKQLTQQLADAIEQKLMALLDARSEKIQEELPNAAKVSKLHKAQGKAFDPADLGFVCSNDQVEQFLMAEAITNEYKNSLKQEVPAV